MNKIMESIGKDIENLIKSKIRDLSKTAALEVSFELRSKLRNEISYPTMVSIIYAAGEDDGLFYNDYCMKTGFVTPYIL